MMRPRIIGIAATAVLGCACCTAAQTPQPAEPFTRSYRGIFGGAATGAARDRSALSVSFLEAYDDNLAADRVGPPQSVLSQGGLYNALLADFTYRSGGSRRQFAVNAGTNLRYYPQEGKVVGFGHYAGAALSTPLWQRSTLTVSQTVAYAPSYWYRLFPPAAAPDPGQPVVADSYAISAEASYAYGTTAVLEMPAGRHNTFTVVGGGRYTDYVSADAVRDLWDYQLGGSVAHGLNATTQLTAGYTGRRTRVLGAVAPEHDLTVGVDFGRRLSQTRMATLSLSLGAAVLQEPAISDPGLAPQRSYRWIGDVAYSRQFGRSWQARGAYHRGFGIIEGIATPLFSDGLTVAAGGFLRRGVDLALLGSYTYGDQSMRPSATSWFTTYTGSARGRIALNATWAVYLEYVYYYYDFRDIVVPVGVPPTARRHALRMGVTTWIPLARSR